MNRTSARPLRRSMIKLVMRVLGGKRRAHYQNWMPHLSVKRQPSSGVADIIYKRKRVAGAVPSGVAFSPRPDVIYIVGSGPSINDNDLSTLEDRSAILLNGAITLLGNEISVPLAVAIEDERFVWRHFDLMLQKIPKNAVCCLSLGVIRAICEIDADWLRDRTIVLIDDLRKPYASGRRSDSELRPLDYVVMDEAGDAGLSLEPDRGVFQGGSVAISALQFAIDARPKSIGLFGIDIRNADRPRFYERAGDMASSGIARAEQRILPYFSLARTVCEERGIDLLSFSSISALEKCGLFYENRFARKRGSD